MDLVAEIYRATAGYPASELYGLTSQMRRAAASVPANVAEGHTREHTREYLQHLSIAQGSLAELETYVELGVRLGFLSANEATALLAKIHPLGKQLYRLRDAVSKRLNRASDVRPLSASGPLNLGAEHLVPDPRAAAADSRPPAPGPRPPAAEGAPC